MADCTSTRPPCLNRPGDEAGPWAVAAAVFANGETRSPFRVLNPGELGGAEKPAGRGNKGG